MYESSTVRATHQIVDLCASSNDRVTPAASIDARVGADLYVVLYDDTKRLRLLAVALRSRNEAKAVLNLMSTLFVTSERYDKR